MPSLAESCIVVVYNGCFLQLREGIDLCSDLYQVKIIQNGGWPHLQCVFNISLFILKVVMTFNRITIYLSKDIIAILNNNFIHNTKVIMRHSITCTCKTNLKNNFQCSIFCILFIANINHLKM